MTDRATDDADSASALVSPPARLHDWDQAVGGGLAMTVEGHDALHLPGQYKAWCLRCREHSQSLRVVKVQAAAT